MNQADPLARRVARLEPMPLFQGLRHPDLATLARDLHLREYARDETVFRQGDESREVYVVLRGKVRIYKISPAGHETTIDIFAAHDVFGELAALDGQPRSASAKAIEDTALLVMAQQRFVQHLEHIPRLALNLAHLLAHKLRWTAAFAESIAQYDAAGRLLHILISYTERYGQEVEPDKVYRLDLPLNQSDLASMVGARREWVNRLLNEWRRRGLLTYRRESLTILDMPRVRAERDSRIEANVGHTEW